MDGIPFKDDKSIFNALKISSSSAKVKTKSMTSFKSFSLASAFFAMQGPIKTTFASGFIFFIIRPAAIIGEIDGERSFTNEVYTFFNMPTHIGQQQDVIIRSPSLFTCLSNSHASFIDNISAAKATSIMSENPILINASRSISIVTLSPN